ncbi:MAG: hypothetical protein BWY74_00385 [Firmicutes bacterium ADurb.Bin419]|nr:MAG: hypothetical protein BWY74_00385 [Firmicutes bacterium ADurb.Bin419]
MIRVNFSIETKPEEKCPESVRNFNFYKSTVENFDFDYQLLKKERESDNSSNRETMTMCKK